MYIYIHICICIYILYILPFCTLQRQWLKGDKIKSRNYGSPDGFSQLILLDGLRCVKNLPILFLFSPFFDILKKCVPFNSFFHYW